jgi:hypothetical protein
LAVTLLHYILMCHYIDRDIAEGCLISKTLNIQIVVFDFKCYHIKAGILSQIRIIPLDITEPVKQLYTGALPSSMTPRIHSLHTLWTVLHSVNCSTQCNI